MITTQPPASIVFGEKVLALRAEYEQMRDRSNLFPPNGRQVLGQFRKFIEGRWIEEFWIQDAANVCGLLTSLQPFPETYFDFIGICHRSRATSRLMAIQSAKLSDHNIRRRMTRRRKMIRRISVLWSQNCLWCRKLIQQALPEDRQISIRACKSPQMPRRRLSWAISPHIIQLLGSSSDGQLVFNKLETRASVKFS